MYATLATMILKFTEREIVQLTDDAVPASGQINMAKLQFALDTANSEVNGYLAGRFSVPVAPAPTVLVGLATDLVRYHLAVGASRLTERDDLRYKAAVKTLEAIRDGKLNIGINPQGGTPAPTVSNDVVIISGQPNVFGNGGW